MERSVAYETDLNLKATELSLGLPGSDDVPAETPPTTPSVRTNKRASPEVSESREAKGSSDVSSVDENSDPEITPPTKAQLAGWPPVRSYMKNCLQAIKKNDQGTNDARIYIKVSVDGAPYLRKVDLKGYKSYPELLRALENMFKLTIGEYSEKAFYNGSNFTPTYEDKDGDWMLVGDVPWDMFISTCKRLRIMKGSEARGLGC